MSPSGAAAGPSNSSGQWIQSLSRMNSTAQLGVNSTVPATVNTTADRPSHSGTAVHWRGAAAAHGAPPAFRLAGSNSGNLSANPARSHASFLALNASFSAVQSPPSSLLHDLQRTPQRSWTGPLVPSSEASAAAGGDSAGRNQSARSASTGENLQGRGAGGRRPPLRRRSSLLRSYRRMAVSTPPVSSLFVVCVRTPRAHANASAVATTTRPGCPDSDLRAQKKGQVQSFSLHSLGATPPAHAERASCSYLSERTKKEAMIHDGHRPTPHSRPQLSLELDRGHATLFKAE
eukprot:956370-Pelagomonas_calceolata.AAC.3